MTAPFEMPFVVTRPRDLKNSFRAFGAASHCGRSLGIHQAFLDDAENGTALRRKQGNQKTRLPML
jgi:hypothetical protein